MRQKIAISIMILLFIGFTLLSTSKGTFSQVSYMGPETCGTCHPENYEEWKESGHAIILLPADKAKERGFPLPSGISWDDIAFTIGGLWKVRYVNTSGYIITWHFEDGKRVPGGNQWNIETKRWVNYHAGEVKKYACGHCHTTGYNPEGTTPGMPGIVGSWVFPGVTCERCHGAGGGAERTVGPHKGTGTPRETLEDPIICAYCHIRTSRDNVLKIQRYSKLSDVPKDLLKVMTDIDAKGGLIRHHEQFEEWYNSPHAKAGVTCQTCHDVHSGEVKVSCENCHSTQYNVFKGSLMWGSGVDCVDCHMAKTVKSAEGRADVFYGDVRSHVFVINISPDAKLTYKDPKTGKEYGNPFIPLGWACGQPGCHGVKGIVEGTAAPLLPKGWDTVKAAEVVAEIQSDVKSKLNTLKDVISKAKEEISAAEAAGVPDSYLVTAKRIVSDAESLAGIIESDGTYGVHNPDVSEWLEDAIDGVKSAGEFARMMASVQSGISGVASDVDALKTTMKSLQDTADALKSKVDHLSSGVEGLSGKVSDLDKKVSNIATQLSDVSATASSAVDAAGEAKDIASSASGNATTALGVGVIGLIIALIAIGLAVRKK